MKIVIKTVRDMLADPDISIDNGNLRREYKCHFFLNGNMEKELCGKTFEVTKGTGMNLWPFLIKGFFVPDFAVKEIIED